MEAESSRLKARTTFSENKALLLDLRDLLKHDIAYDKCLKAVSPIQVTTKKKELDEAHVQDGLRSALTDELKALRLTIPVNLGFSTRKAKSFHKVIVEETDYSADIAKIISEGESRALALACFLAQIRQSPHAGIVVDDPVSSLDHNRRDFVAERLVTRNWLRHRASQNYEFGTGRLVQPAR